MLEDRKVIKNLWDRLQGLRAESKVAEASMEDASVNSDDEEVQMLNGKQMVETGEELDSLLPKTAPFSVHKTHW